MADKLILSKKALRAIRVFSNAKRAEAAVKARKARAEAVIREALGDATIAFDETGLAVVELKPGTNSSFDREVLEKRFPDAFKAAKKVTTYTYVKTV